LIRLYYPAPPPCFIPQSSAGTSASCTAHVRSLQFSNKINFSTSIPQLYNNSSNHGRHKDYNEGGQRPYPQEGPNRGHGLYRVGEGHHQALQQGKRVRSNPITIILVGAVMTDTFSSKGSIPQSLVAISKPELVSGRLLEVYGLHRFRIGNIGQITRILAVTSSSRSPADENTL
jgi:hypothetical protein